jgi:hypothetical protein
VLCGASDGRDFGCLRAEIAAYMSTAEYTEVLADPLEANVIAVMHTEFAGERTAYI